MRRFTAALAMSLAMAALCASAQNGYQYSRLAPDPALKSVQIPESILMRAAYEARMKDCVDSRQHLDAVLNQRPNWAPIYAVRLICARQEGQETEERENLNALISLQPQYWRWWHDSAELHGKSAELPGAISEITKAIQLRPWDPALYAARSGWRERARDYTGAFEDAAKMYELTPALGAPLERMSRLSARAGRSETEAKQYHSLAEINPEQLPLAVRDDSDLPTAKMPPAELLLRAGYALRAGRNELALRLAKAVLAKRPDTPAALEMYHDLWKRGLVDVDTAHAAIVHLVKLNGQRADFYRWLIEMGASEADQIGLYRAIVAVEPFEAKSYADLAEAELRFEPKTGAIEPSLPSDIPWPPSTQTASAVQPSPAARARSGTRARQDPAAAGQVSGFAEGDFQRAINLDPSDPAWYFGLARALDGRSAFPLEIMALNMALIGDPDNSGYQAARAKLP